VTSFTDDFNRSDEDLTASSNWVDGLQGSFGVSLALESNRVNGGQTNGSSDGAVWATACDTDAQWAEGLVYSTDANGGYTDMAVCVNALASEFTAYMGIFVNDNGTRGIELWKVVDGDWGTVLASDSYDAVGETLRIEHDGSGGLTLYSDDVEQLSYTDGGTALTGGTVGLHAWKNGFGASTHFDDFAGGDIAPAGGGPATYVTKVYGGSSWDAAVVKTYNGSAIAATLLDSGTSDVWHPDGTNVDGFTTASVSPGADALLVLLLTVIDSNQEDLIPGSVASSGSGPAWSTDEYSDDAGGDWRSSSAAFAVETGGSDPGAFTVTWTAGGDDPYEVGYFTYALWEVTGYDTDAPIVGGAASSDQAGNGPVTLTMDATPSADQLTIALCSADQNTSDGYSTFGTGTGIWIDTDIPGLNGGVTGYRIGYSADADIDWSDVQSTPDTVYTSAQTALIIAPGAGWSGSAVRG